MIKRLKVVKKPTNTVQVIEFLGFTRYNKAMWRIVYNNGRTCRKWSE